MLVSEVTGHNVVDISTAETLARVDEFLIDPATRTIVAITVKKSKQGTVLRWPDLTAFGPDAVTVADAGKLGETDERLTWLADKHRRPMGRRVLSTAGDELGTVSDIDFDPASGAVTSFVLGETQIPGDQLVGIGTWAVVVRTAESAPSPG